MTKICSFFIYILLKLVMFSWTIWILSWKSFIIYYWWAWSRH